MSTGSRRSFRTRLAVQTMLVAGVVLAIFGAGSWWFARRQLARTVDLRLTESTRRLWSALTPRSTEADFRRAVRGVFGESPELSATPAVIVKLNDTAATLLFSTSNPPAADDATLRRYLPLGDPGIATRPEGALRGRPALGGPGDPGTRRPQMPELRPPVFFTEKSARGEWRFGAFANPHYTVFVGLSLHDFYSEARRLAGWHAAAAALGLALAGLGAWWTSGRATRPLARVITTAEQLTASAFDRRIPAGPHDDREFSQLIAVLNATMDRLQASFQQAARFTADASHELKTPLAVMQATLHDALRESPPGTPEHERLESLARESARLKGITQSLLLLSQADAGKLPLTRECYDLSADLARLVEDAEALCAQAGLRCAHEITPGLIIDADRALMRHVFQNLLSNAVKYNRPDGEVRLTLAAEEGRAVFTIENTGPGIPAADQPRLFERFFRTDTARHSEGSGLGLNIASELARANGASLQLVTSAGDRTVFRVTIPCV